MERPCRIRRAGCGTRSSLCHALRRASLKTSCATPVNKRLVGCCGIANEESYDTGLTRSQEARRQRRARRRASSSGSPPWSPSDPASNRAEWLHCAKEQLTEALLAALLAPEDVPLPRLPVLLTLLEGRTDLPSCVAAVGLSAVADAVLRSDMLQRLLPGGVLMEQLMRLMEERARDAATPVGELLTAAQLVAVWRPPAACDVLAPAAAAVAVALAGRCTGLAVAAAATTAGHGKVRSSSSNRRDVAEAAKAAEALNSDADIVALAKGLLAVRPWLVWRASTGAGSAAAAVGGGDAPLPEALVGDGFTVMEGAEKALDGVQAAVAALLRFADGRMAAEAEEDTWAAEAAAVEPSAVFAVLAAAVQYGVEVPPGFTKEAARMTAVAPQTVPSPVSSTSTSSSSAPLAAQLVALACCSSSVEIGSSGRSGGGILLDAADVRGLVAPHLAPELTSQQHISFLTALLSALREQTWMPGAGRRESAAAAAGLLEALGGAAAHLRSPVALALAMECAADSAAAAAAVEARAAGGEEARLLLAAASAQAASRTAAPEELCRLAAAATRLQRYGSGDNDESAVAAAAQVLAAVQAVPLREVTVEAAAALIAAAWAPSRIAVSGGDGSVEVTSAPANRLSDLPSPLLDALLERLAMASASVKAGPPVQRRRCKQPPQAAVAAAVPQPPPLQLSYDQAVAVLATIVAAAEAAADAAPSTSDVAAPPPALPAARAAALRAAGLVACRTLVPAVRQLDPVNAIRLLHLVSRAEREGVRPNFPQLLWALHERLRALAASRALGPQEILNVLQGCVWLRWRPTVLLRELLLPLVIWLQLDDATAAAAAAGGAVTGAAAAAREDNGLYGMGDDPRVSGGGGAGAAAAAAATARASWTPREVKYALALLARLRVSGPLALAVVKLGVGWLLRASAADAAATAASGRGGDGGSEGAAAPATASSQLTPSDLAMLLWVCALVRYRGAAVLRPLLQQLLQVPPARVPVKAAAQAVWAAARLDVVGERLVRWSLAACQGAAAAYPGTTDPGAMDKLTAAAPQSLALLCWGLAKLGVRPPRTFVQATIIASGSRICEFKPEELATTLFVLANWGANLRGGAAAAAVRHVVATAELYDGPALCTAVWALQRLTAPLDSADADGGGADLEAAAAAGGGTAAALDAATLRGFEDRLLAVNLVADPRFRFPDNHLLRFFSACGAGGGGDVVYRPERLLHSYASQLLPRLRVMQGVSPTDKPTAAGRISRSLWAASRILAIFPLRDHDLQLLPHLERCAERCQSQLQPAHLAGIINAMAALGYYPARWAERGLLRRMGLALRHATLTEVGLILEALAAWQKDMAAAAAAAAAGSSGAVAVGSAAAAVAEHGVVAGTHKLRGPSPQRLNKLRQLVEARLAELCVPAAAAATQPPAAAAATGPPATSAAAVAAIEIDLGDAIRVLVALARLRWRCGPAEAALVRAAARLPLKWRRVSELTRLMWALAALRLDVPELLESLQAALLGLQPQPSIAEETALMEAGRAGSIRTAGGAAAGPSEAAVAAASATAAVAPVKSPGQQPSTAAAAAPAETPASTIDSPPPTALGPSVASGASVTEPSAASSDGSGSSSSGIVGAGPPADGPSGSGKDTALAASPDDDSGGSSTGGGNAATPPRGDDLQLLSRPAMPPPAAADPAADASTSSTAVQPFDPAAVMAAAAAEVAQRYEQQLGGSAGRSQLPTEPWAPEDVFRALWSCAKMNRHPGPQLLAAAERSWLTYTADVAASGGGGGGTAAAPKPLPLHTITGLLWSLSVFRQHNGSFAQRLAEQLGTWLREGGDLLSASSDAPVDAAAAATVAAADDSPAGNDAQEGQKATEEAQQQRGQERQQRLEAFYKQSAQVAACLLAAQADRIDSPLNAALPPELRARLVASWRARLAQRLVRSRNQYGEDLASVLRKMGLTAAANVPTPDGCALVDVAVALRRPPPQESAAMGATALPPPPRLLALEFVGRHNTAANSPRILGEAVIKYRLLQSRGYLIVPIPCYEWDRIPHKDVWTKMVYLQAKIDRRTAATATTSGGSLSPAAPVAVAAASAGNGNGSAASPAAAASAVAGGAGGGLGA